MIMVLNQYPSEKDVRNGKIAMIVLSLLFIALWAYIYYVDKSLRKHLIITKGIVTAVEYRRQHHYAYYRYTVKQKEYESNETPPIFKSFNDREILIGKVFPVISDSTSPSRGKMLFDSLSFVNYGLQFPDTLNWLKPYLE